MGLSENCEARGFAGFFEACGGREALPGRVVGPALTRSRFFFLVGLLSRQKKNF